MPITTRKSAATVAVIGALGLGGGAIAGAADDSASSSNSASGNASQDHASRPQRQSLSSAIATKVKAAAIANVPDATVLRMESGGPYDAAYHAHIENADGTRSVVLVSRSSAATAVQADRGRGPGGPRGGDHGAGETALTGTTKQKVEAAALAELPGATIVRTETSNDSTAPYESHVRKSDGAEVEVLVSRSFEVVAVRERPARP